MGVLHRVRWGRLAGALVVATVWGWASALAMLWVTADAPTPAERSRGDAPCVAAEVLAGAPEVSDDARVGDLLVYAAQCGTLGDLQNSQWFDVYQAIQRGLPTIRERSTPEEALDRLLDVWALVADEQDNGPLVHLALWTAVGLTVAQDVGRVLADPGLSPAAHAAAVPQLKALARDEVDWVALRPYEEQSTWSVLRAITSRPSLSIAWLPLAPQTLWQARRGTHPIVTTLREDEVGLRSQARLLASLAESPAR